jgi:hypothetical protein
MAKFGDKYKDLIKLNPNKKSLPNNNPGIVQGPNFSSNPYAELIISSSYNKSLFNNDPGIIYVSPKSNNPYFDLVKEFKSTLPVTASFITGRTTILPVYYVVDGYVDTGYVEIQSIQ